MEQVWRRCQERGDIYRGSYSGLYRVGCEQFYVAEELRDRRYPKHKTLPEQVQEENYFFRLSRYQDELRRLVSTNELRVLPAERVDRTAREVAEAVETFALHEALASIFRLVAAGNRYVDQTKPWVLAKAERSGAQGRSLDRVLYALADLIRAVGLLLVPFLPTTAQEILGRVGVDGGRGETVRARALVPGTRVKAGPPLFPKKR